MRVFRTTSAALVLAAFAVGADAQTLRKPKEFYFDQDASARAITVVEPGSAELAEALMRERERGRRQLEATAQLGHMAMDSGRIELGRSLYEQALSSTQANSALGRSVRWNYAWDLCRSGDAEAALAHFSAVVGPVGGHAWVPPTLALVLWRLDRRAEALEWYAAAVRTEPTLWDNPANYPQLLPEWRAQDHAVLAEVYAAWRAAPPAWP